MTISSLEDLLRSTSMILEEQYNTEWAKPDPTSNKIREHHNQTEDGFEQN